MVMLSERLQRTVRDDIPGGRGMRNNNPGNIKLRDGAGNIIPWRGLRKDQKDPTFSQFTSAKWGIRAIARQIQTTQRESGAKTIKDLITVYAPDTENNTRKYIESVSARTGIPQDALIDLDDPVTSKQITEAIIFHELDMGFQPFKQEFIHQGVDLADLMRAPPQEIPPPPGPKPEGLTPTEDLQAIPADQPPPPPGPKPPGVVGPPLPPERPMVTPPGTTTQIEMPLPFTPSPQTPEGLERLLQANRGGAQTPFRGQQN